MNESARTNLDNGRVLFAAFDKFLVGKLGVFVSVHISKDLVHTLGSERD